VTSSPYVPSSEGQNQFDEPVTTWEPAGTTEAGTDIYAPSTGQSTPPTTTTDTAKNEAADLKDTAVTSGQQVAGVAKEQAGAVKDTAVASGQQVAAVAKEQAGAVKDTAVAQGQQVAAVAKDEAGKVAAEATEQIKDLLNQGRTELSSQISSQQARLGSIVHSFAEELGSMASSSSKSGPLTDLAHQGSRRVGELAHRLENSEATELLDDLRSFARRRPGAFLGASLLAGVVVGRLTRSLAAEAKDAKEAQQAPALGSGYATTTPATGYDTGSYTTGAYETGSYTAGTAATTGYEPARAYDGTVAYDDTVTYDETVTYVEPRQGDTPR